MEHTLVLMEQVHEFAIWFAEKFDLGLGSGDDDAEDGVVEARRDLGDVVELGDAEGDASVDVVDGGVVPQAVVLPPERVFIDTLLEPLHHVEAIFAIQMTVQYAFSAQWPKGAFSAGILALAIHFTWALATSIRSGRVDDLDHLWVVVR